MRPIGRYACAAFAVSLTLAASARTARANGRFPAAGMLVAQPNDPSHLVLRATYGILLSSDGGKAWDWLCEKPVGYGGAEDPSVVVTGSGAVLAGTFKGMARSSDRGCTWQHDVTWPTAVVDMAARPSVPDRVYALTCIYARTSDAGASLFRSELLVSDDAGAHWTSLAQFDPALLLDSVEVAPSDPNRVYVTAIRPHGAQTSAVVLRSDDDGRHFHEHPFEFSPADRGVYIAGVDPKKANVLYLRTSGPEANRLAVSDDSGSTSRVVFSTPALQGFTLADDGATVYAGSPKGGLVRASVADYRFEKKWAGGVLCLTTIGKELWACTPTVSGFVLGASVDDGATFSPRLTLAGMRGPLACAEGSTAAACATDWAALRQLVGFDDPRDAGPPRDASPVGTTAPRASACGCVTAGASSERSSTFAFLLLVPAFFAARRRRRLFES